MTRLARLMVLLLTLLGAGCGAAAKAIPTMTPPPRGQANLLRWWNNSGTRISTLDPARVTDPISTADVQLINAGLVKLDYPSLRVQPDLATWDVSSHGRVYTFHLRPGARFGNGDPLSARDVKWSLTRALLPSTHSVVAFAYLGAIQGAAAVRDGVLPTLQGVRVLDPHTLSITLDGPVSYFLRALTFSPAAVLDRAFLQRRKDVPFSSDDCSGVVGAGPFRLVCRTPAGATPGTPLSVDASRLAFQPNPYYWAPPRIQIVAPFYSHDREIFNAYVAGHLDGAPVPASAMLQAKRLPGYSQVPSLSTDYITPNTQAPPFDNLHCRLAVAYAINRQALARRIWHGTERPLFSVVPPSVAASFGYRAGLPAFNRTRAKAELAQCPGRLGGVHLTYQRTSQDTARTYRLIQADLAAVGAGVSLQPLSLRQWLGVVSRKLTASRTAITENLWVGVLPEPSDWLTNLLQSNGPFNIGGYRNPVVDTLIARAQSAGTPRHRADLYRQAQVAALSEGAYIPLGTPSIVYVVSPHVTGMIATAYGPQPIRNDWSRVHVRP